MDEPVPAFGPVGRTTTARPQERHPAFEVQFLLESDGRAAAEIRRRLDAVGESLAMVGGGGLFNVHVHTDSPDAAIEIGNEAGEVRDVTVASLAQEAPACSGNWGREVQVGQAACGLVAVVEGAGLIATFRSLGATVVPGSPARPPAVAELLAAVEAAHPRVVAVLPNDRDIMGPAETAAERSVREVSVVPAMSIPAGLSAATAFNPTLPLADNMTAMRAAAEACRMAQLAVAGRPSDSAAGRVEAGDWTAMVAGRVVAAGRRVADVVAQVVDLIADGRAEMLTLVVGRAVAPDDGAAVVEALRTTRPDLELEVIDGGHPEYPLLIGVE
jgi:dihydroxyacetone kinase-like predicted kinase